MNNFYDPSITATNDRLLRRTLVRSEFYLAFTGTFISHCAI